MKSKLPISHGATQPILCCLGESVAGSSTQFLMERAIEATELDWRAITVEVAPAQLESALAGMTAMKFMAARFFPSLQKQAAELLGVDNPTIQFLGAVTSAMRFADGWQAWHHWGSAVLQWASQENNPRQLVCWLHGDGIRCRSLLVALAELAQRNSDNLPPVVLWTDPPSTIPANWLSLPRTDGVIQVELFPETRVSGELFLDRLRPLQDEQSVVSALVVGEECPVHLFDRQESNLSWLWAGSSDLINQAARLELETSVCLSEVEQNIACEAMDFERWTGQRVSLALLRDAYEEYSDF